MQASCTRAGLPQVAAPGMDRAASSRTVLRLLRTPQALDLALPKLHWSATQAQSGQQQNSSQALSDCPKSSSLKHPNMLHKGEHVDTAASSRAVAKVLTTAPSHPKAFSPHLLRRGPTHGQSGQQPQPGQGTRQPAQQGLP